MIAMQSAANRLTIPREVASAALISDLHLSPEDPRAVEIFVNFTKKLPGAVRELFILGDLFEAYVGAKHLRVPGYAPVVAALRGLASAGISVTVLKGNRDFLLDSNFTKITGAAVAGDETSFTCGGKKFLLVHGDLFCIRDVRYQAMRRKLRSPMIQFASRSLPLFVSLRVAAKLRKTSMKEIQQKTPSEMGIVDSEVSARLAQGYDYVICGHVHDPRVTKLQNGTLVVLPAWPMEPGTCRIAGGVVSFDGAG